MNVQKIHNAILVKLQEIGLVVDDFQADGQLHRCGTAKNPRGLDGAYRVHLDPPVSLWWQNWQTGLSGTWCAKDGKQLSKQEREALAARIAEDRRQAEEEQQRRYAEAALKAQKIWQEAKPVEDQAHAYLEKKGVLAHGLRISGKALVVPVFKAKGEIQSLQFISEDGTKRFLSGGRTKGGYFYIGAQENSDEPLCVVEGYATGASVHEATGFDVLVAFNAGNLLPVAQMARKFYSEREIVLCADYDDSSETYPQAGGVGLAKATEAALAIGASLAVPDLRGEKCDFNDVAQIRGLRAVARQILLRCENKVVKVESRKDGLQSRENCLRLSKSEVVNSRKKVVNDEAHLPDGFYFVEEGPQAGLWYEMEQTGQNKDGSEKEPIQIYLGPRLEVIAESRDTRSEGWAKLARWHDPKGVEHRRLIPMAAVARADAGPWLAEILAAGGWYPATGKGVSGLLKKYLLESRPSKFVRQVQRSGWHDNAFILPTGTIGQVEGEEVLFDGAENTAFAEGGTLEGWQSSIGEMSRGNSRMLFAVSAAFVPPLLGPCGAESGGVVFVGGSSSGKTTCLQASASAWGRGSESGGYLRTWRATANGIEGTASEFSDCLLALDELGQVDGREIGAITYMLANGQGKARAKRNGDARQVKNWRSFILSTGEVSVKQMVEAGGRKSKAGQDVRLVCIPADAGADMGAFEDLHDYPDAGSFAKAIKAAACENYGHAAKAFIRAFQEHREDAVQSIKEALGKSLSIIFPSEELFAEADGQVLRVASRFLLVALAGESAAEWEIVHWEQGEALAAARRCFSDWLAERGSVGAAEDEAIVHDVAAFLEANGQSRFQAWEATDKVIGRVGFRKMEDDRTIFYVLPTGFEQVCSGHNEGRAKKILHERGLLLKKEVKGYTYPVTLPGMGLIRCYILTLGANDEMD